MANQRRRPRGRPKGTGKDDSAALNRIADLLAADPSLKPTTAMRRIGVHNDSDTRRLQVKWKAAGAALLAAARVRKNKTEEARPPAVPPSDLLSAISAIAARTEDIRRVLKRPAAEFRRQQKLIQQFEAQQRMIRQTLGRAEELRRIQESLNPRWLRRRY